MSDKQCVQTHTMQFGFARAADCDSVPVYNVMYGTTCSLQKSNAMILLDEVETWVTGGAWSYVALHFVRLGCYSSHKETSRRYQAKDK
jgi:hypothetical protein